MTEIEARGYIKGKLDCMNKCDTFDCLNSDDCDECDYCYAQGTFGEQKEAFEIAIQALEKQIPKKPYVQQDDRNNDCMECPFCDSFIGYECDCRDEHYQIDYCPNCGQAIDWS